MVFGYTILNNESEDSYVWLLWSFLEALKRKALKSVMKDGDLAMKSAISTTFPGVHHRLCSWHSLRNDTAKVGRFVSSKKIGACTLFEVAMYYKQRAWVVAWAEEDEEFSFSCQRVSNDDIRVGEIPDAAYMSMHATMLDDCRELVNLSCRFFEDYFDMKKILAKERLSLREKYRQRLGNVEERSRLFVRDPLRARYKGCSRRVVTTRGKFRYVKRCQKCEKAVHNARKCPKLQLEENMEDSKVVPAYENMVVEEESDDYFDVGRCIGTFSVGAWAEDDDILWVIDDTDMLHFKIVNGDEIAEIVKKHLVFVSQV
ncbi:hypothetical protein AHAS_Ahas20G0145200 [Arachis hypogaea]